MTRLPVTIILVVLAALASLPALANDVEWQPQKTWVFAVGTLEWEDSEAFPSFPKENRRDAQLVRFFQQQGVPSDHIVYLVDAKATTARVQTALMKLLARTSEGDLFFFYYTGHGYQSDDRRKTFFATYDANDEEPGWSTESIVRTIAKNFNGDRVILTADCCFSGSLVDKVRRVDSDKSFACFSSSTSKDLSTGNWTFTEMLLAGLRGRSYADLDSDGEVTLGEIARSLHDDMLFAEDQRSVSIFKGDLGVTTVIANAPPKRDGAIGRRIEAKSEGDWYKARIIDARNRKYLVRYYGYEVSDDEWVRAENIRTAQ